MKDVTIKNGYLEVDGQKEFILSGEIQYFRLEKDKWRTILDAFRESNCNTLSTYVPWNWHEYERGKYDFTGETHPSRDLVGFLELVKEYGFHLIIKGGPHIHAEFKDGGVPEWVFKDFPQVLMKDVNGNPSKSYTFYPAITYLHPDYMALVKEWFTKFAEIALPYDNIIMWQLDNEISYSISFFGYIGMGQWYTGDYNPTLVDNGLYQEWLKEKYVNIEVLNERYVENNWDFAQVEPPKKEVLWGDHPSHQKAMDWVEFRTRLVSWYIKSLIEILYELGVRGPFSVDDPLLHFDSSWKDIYDEVKDQRWEFCIGYTFYDGSSLEEVQGNHLRRIELTRASGSPLVGNHEMQAGDMYFLTHWKQLTSDYDILWKTAVGYGNNMINLYWFADGYNFDGYEHFMPDLNLNSPLSKDGEKRPHFEVCKKIGRFVKENPWIVETEVQYDMGIGFYHQYAKAGKFFNMFGVEKNEFLRGGIVGSFLDAVGVCNINFKLLNLQCDIHDANAIPGKKLAVILHECLDGNVQHALVNFVKAGGHLIMMGDVPIKNENFHWCHILWDQLGIERFDILPYNPQNLYVVNRVKYKDIDLCVPANIKTYTFKEGAEYTADLVTYPDKKVCGFTRKIGQGKISVLGFLPQVFMQSSRDFARDYFGKESRDGIFVYERKKGDNSLFTLINMFEEPTDVTLGGQTFTAPGRRGTFVIKQGNEYKLWEE